MTIPAIGTRGSWGARYQDGDLTLTGLAQEVFVHHTVTATLPQDASIEDEREQMREIEAIGQSRFGTGISYNVLVFPSGRAHQGVSWNRRGTHTGGMNSTVRSICFAGNYETAEPTDAQIATASAIYRGGKGVLWRADAPLRGHRDVKETACPGKNVYSRLGDIRAGLTPYEQEEFLMTLSTTEQETVLAGAEESIKKVYDEATNTWDVQADSLRKNMVVTRRGVRATDALRVEVRALSAAVTALAASAGLDGERITQAVSDAVAAALADIKITLSNEEDL